MFSVHTEPSLQTPPSPPLRPASSTYILVSSICVPPSVSAAASPTYVPYRCLLFLCFIATCVVTAALFGYRTRARSQGVRRRRPSVLRGRHGRRGLVRRHEDQHAHHGKWALTLGTIISGRGSSSRGSMAEAKAAAAWPQAKGKGKAKADAKAVQPTARVRVPFRL